MSYKPMDEKTLGLCYKNDTASLAVVVYEKGQYIVKRLLECSFLEHEEDHVKRLYNSQDEKEFKNLAQNYLAVATLPESDVLVRRLKLKLTREKDIDEAFAFQAEPELPYPIDLAILDKIIVEKSEDSTLIVFLATKKEYVQNVLESWLGLGIDPEVVSCEPVAINALLNGCAPLEPLQYAVHIGKTATLSVLLKNGKLLAAHSVQLGWESLFHALQLDNPEIALEIPDLFSSSLNVLETKESSHLKKAIDELLQMILWNHLALMKETKIKETPLLYVLGEGANILHLPSLISGSLGINLGVISPLNNCTLENLNKFAMPIGLALTAQQKMGMGINFRSMEFSYSTPWKRFKQPFLIYAALCALLAASLYFFGLSTFNYRENNLKNQFLSLLSFTQKPFDVFEAQYEQKYPDEKKGSEITSIQDLKTADIERRLDFLENTLKSMPDTFPLLPNTPRVSDVLVWLSSHPQLICKDQGANLDCPSFAIDLFNYTLVKRPEITKKNERYQVKIDLEFSTASPRLAREFHDALITSNDFVDPKGEIKWTATKGKYRTSFFLKDRTAYP